MDSTQPTGTAFEDEKGAEKKAILDWLTSIDYDYLQNDFIGRRQEGTGQWLLQSVEFCAWTETKQQTMFCPGIPWAGKTIITSIVVDELLGRFQADESIGIAYIYFNFKRHDEQTPAHILSSLLTQLIRRMPSIPPDVESLYYHHKDSNSVPSVDKISENLQSVILMYKRVFIVIDALDECQSGYWPILQEWMFDVQIGTRVNLFVTSRDIPAITEMFQSGILLTIRATSDDVQKYVDGHMGLLPRCIRRRSDLQEEVKTQIVACADGMFLLAKLDFYSLRNAVTVKSVIATLQKMFSLSNMYDAFDREIRRIENQNSATKELAKLALLWIAYAKRPLNTIELQNALAVKAGESKVDNNNIPEAEDIVSACIGLVTIDIETSIIRFSHCSISEYFYRTKERSFSNAETNITTTCLTYLSLPEFERGFCSTDEAFEARLNSRPLYSYAAQYWGDHASVVLESGGEIPLDFLQSTAKVSSSYQVVQASSWGSVRGYCQETTSQVTGLHLAAYFGLEKAITALLANGLHATSKDGRGQTALRWAAEKGSEPVMKLLSQRDRITLPTLIREGEHGLAKSILHAGYDINVKGFWNRTVLHTAILSGNSELVDDIISSGAHINSRDNDGMTPLQLAVSLKQLKLAELLLKRSASTKGVTMDDWRCAYGKQASVVVKLLEDPGQEKYVQFIEESEIQSELMKTRSDLGAQRRYLLFPDDSPWEKGWIHDLDDNLMPNELLHIQEWSGSRSCTHSITVWCSLGMGQENKRLFNPPMEDKIRITWTMVWFENSSGEPYCKSMDHFSTMKDLWIMEYSLQPFICLMKRLKEYWLELCYLAQGHLFQCGEEAVLIGLLLEDAQKWTDFRSYVRDQVDDARKFGIGYSRRYHEEVALRELQAVIDDFEREINAEIDVLDKSSQSLIGIEFNLVSINEARRSTSMAASMKRLSWITFVFLPAMFASSLFGMNVSILKDNPDWRWYLLFGGSLQTLTLVGWLSFKYIPIELWIEHKVRLVQDKFRRKPRVDVENVGNKSKSK